MLELLEVVPHGLERADVLCDLAATWVGDSSTLADLYDQALVEAVGDDARTARILAFRAWVRMLAADNVTALADARAALENAERVGDPGLVASVIARVGQLEMWAGDITPGLLERGAELEERHGLVFDYLASPRFWLARLRMRQGDLDEAQAARARTGRRRGGRTVPRRAAGTAARVRPA
jgi:hypothetical protein